MNVKFWKKKHAIIAIMKSPAGAIVEVGRPRARGRGPRGSIEISKCLNVTNSRGSRVEFRERGDRFVTLLECFLNFLSALYLDRQCMDSGKMSQFEAKGKIMIRNKNKNKTKKNTTTTTKKA